MIGMVFLLIGVKKESNFYNDLKKDAYKTELWKKRCDIFMNGENSKTSSTVFNIVVTLALFLTFLSLGSIGFSEKYPNASVIVQDVCMFLVVGSLGITVIASFVISKLKSKSNYIKCVKEVFGEKAFYKELKDKVVIEGSKFKLGSMRERYVFSILVPLLKCRVSKFILEVLSDSSNEHSEGNTWRERYAFIKYEYVVSENFDINNESVKKNIAKLKEKKDFEVKLVDNNLVFEKLTKIYDVEYEDALEDVNDIKLFYESIIDLK